MEELVRLESLIIKGIKNVEYGEITFDEMTKIKEHKLDDFNCVLGIYGQNGSGKTTALETTKILKSILSGEGLPQDIHQYISNESQHAEIECTFYIKTQSFEQLITYTTAISQIQKENNYIYDIVYEKMISKEYNKSEDKWLSQKILFEVENNEIVLKKLLKKLSTEAYIGLKVAKEIEVGKSFFFNSRNLSYIVSELKDKNEENLIETLRKLNIYSKTTISQAGIKKIPVIFWIISHTLDTRHFLTCPQFYPHFYDVSFMKKLVKSRVIKKIVHIIHNFKK